MGVDESFQPSHQKKTRVSKKLSTLGKSGKQLLIEASFCWYILYYLRSIEKSSASLIEDFRVVSLQLPED